MKQVNLTKAKAHLSELVAQATEAVKKSASSRLCVLRDAPAGRSSA